MYLNSKICFRRVLMIFQKTNDPSMKSCFIAFAFFGKKHYDMLTMNHSSSEFQIPLKVKSSDKISVHETIRLSLLNPLVPGVH